MNMPEKVAEAFEKHIENQMRTRDIWRKKYDELANDKTTSGTDESVEASTQISNYEIMIRYLKNYRVIWVAFIERMLKLVKEENKARWNYDIDIFDDGDEYKLNIICNKHVLTIELWGSCSIEMGKDVWIRYSIYRRHCMPSKWTEAKINLDYYGSEETGRGLLDKLISSEKPLAFKPNSRI